jgi:hypothetical protein
MPHLNPLQRRGYKNTFPIYFEVLSFGEDLGEAISTSTTPHFPRAGYAETYQPAEF